MSDDQPMSLEDVERYLYAIHDPTNPQIAGYSEALLAHDAALRAENERYQLEKQRMGASMVELTKENERLVAVAQRHIKESGEKYTQYEQDQADLRAQLATSEARVAELGNKLHIYETVYGGELDG